jgi:hypothetical protein
VTGNEDGVKACARDVFYALQHIGYTISPATDWREVTNAADQQAS